MQGKRPQNYEDSAKIFIISIIILFVLLVLSIFGNAADKPEKTGYLVAIEGFGRKTEIIKTDSPEKVNEVVNKYMKTFCFDVKTVLHNSVYVQYYTSKEGIYVEKKRITAKGKYRRLRDK